MHPELLGLWSAEVTLEPGGVEPGRSFDLDLATTPLWGESLRVRLAQCGSWRVARGATGRALVETLGPLGWTAFEFPGESHGARTPERWLMDGMGDPSVPAWRLDLSRLELRPTELSVSAARDARAAGCLTLLPLRCGPALEADLQRALERVGPAAGGAERHPWLPIFVSRSAQDPGSPGASADEARMPPAWIGAVATGAAGELEADGKVRNALLELLRCSVPDRLLRYRAFENWAAVGADPFAEALLGRWDVEPQEVAQKTRAKVLVVCGIDGAGKSRHVAHLRASLEARGLRVAVHKLFRHGLFHGTVTDLTRACAQGTRLRLWRLQRTAKLLDSLKVFHGQVRADLEACDVVLFDRYTYTHLAAGRGRYHHDPYARELCSVLPAPERVFLLDLPASEADRRIGTRAERTVDENPYMLGRYRHVLLDLADREGFMVLDARAPFRVNAERIGQEAAVVLGLQSGGGAANG